MVFFIRLRRGLDVFMRDTCGAVLSEYLVAAGFLGVGAVVGVAAMVPAIDDVFSSKADYYESTNDIVVNPATFAPVNSGGSNSGGSTGGGTTGGGATGGGSTGGGTTGGGNGNNGNNGNGNGGNGNAGGNGGGNGKNK